MFLVLKFDEKKLIIVWHVLSCHINIAVGSTLYMYNVYLYKMLIKNVLINNHYDLLTCYYKLHSLIFLLPVEI